MSVIRRCHLQYYFKQGNIHFFIKHSDVLFVPASKK